MNSECLEKFFKPINELYLTTTMKNKILYVMGAVLSVMQVGCDNADDLLNQYIEDGPIVYAGRIEVLDIKSGYQKVGVRIVPAEDVNRAYCMLRWNTASGAADSVKVDYTPANYHDDFEGYYTVVDMPDIEGNVLIEAWNVDAFGNKSLLTDQGGFVYGPNYVRTLLPSSVGFTAGNQAVEFDNRVGAVDNLVSYEQQDGQFTEEVTVVESLELINPKSGGVVRSKTRYLINENDIDTLVTPDYLETVIPQVGER
ncbi:uncharacterized protein DUF4998 [Sphingobacterium allocomposti]|uniref:Uncharacterized protein DUF4998 n=2 Tax=Sphingobacterium allocomposti TaxID=415956 RepID=A0A5S5CWN3_9SPHI|nr:uncharacterized protein DUF4998 [Sphingobacterium composti Yoo et al. 2007 non Ten et al. 2007]